MYAINRHLGQVEEPSVGLEEALAAETKPYETLFSVALSGEELKEDNETFAIALLDSMDLNGQLSIINAFQIPASIGDWTIIKLMASAFLAVNANDMNISLRQEMTRVFLDEALLESGVMDARKHGLGSWLSEIFKTVKNAIGDFIENVVDWFKNLGKWIGTGLRKFGDWIRRIYQIIYKAIPFAKYLMDLIGLTPAIRFVFGDLLREIGYAWETGKSVDWKTVAHGAAVYLEEMAFRLKVASNLLTPPWNIIARVVSVVFKVGSGLIDGALAAHVSEVMQKMREKAGVARAAYERALFEDVYEAYGLAGIPPMLPSMFGSTGSNNLALSGREFSQQGLVKIGFGAAAGYFGLRMLGVIR